MTSEATKASNRIAINNTVSRFSPGGDPRWMFAFAERESGFNHAARAKSEADAAGARKAWIRQKPKYIDHGSAHVQEIEDNWLTSWGLFQLMAPYHIQRWSWTAHPNVLINPVTATVIAGRLFNRAQQLGAKNIVDVRQLWGTGSVKRVEPGWSKRKESLQARFKRHGLPDDAWDWPLEKWGMRGFGTKSDTAQFGMYQEVAKPLGLAAWPDIATPAGWSTQDPVDPDVTPIPPDELPQTLHVGRIIEVAAVAAVGAGLLWGLRKR
jgi:hypothetical protein